MPDFYLNRLSVRDADSRELARLLTYEPVSENPVFSRMPTTPHADPKRWLASLGAIAPLLADRTVVPSHGPVHRGTTGVAATRDYLRWLDASFTRWAAQGAEVNEVLRGDVPAPFRDWAAFPAEYVRNVAHLWPRYEREALAR